VTVTLSEPVVQPRSEQPYVAVRAAVPMATMGTVVPELFDEIMNWAAARNAIQGAPFIRYLEIDMKHELLIEVGVPVAPGVPGDDRVLNGALPAGRYLTATHVGPYDRLEAATARLLQRADELSLDFDVVAGDRGEVWAARVEEYPSNPDEQPDPETWQTVLAFKLRD
jgi:effector-binding domain-containing protein